MKTTRLVAVIPLCLAIESWAGQTESADVLVDLEFRSAQGDLATARFSDNDAALIGCGTRTFSQGADDFLFGFCQATDAEGVNFTCVTENPVLVDAIQAISSYAFITFGWDEAGNCTRVGSSTQSLYIPDFRDKKSKK